MSDITPHALASASHLRRSRRRWRLLAFFAIAIAVLVGAVRFGSLVAGDADHIARLRINGVIQTDPTRQAIIARLNDNDRVKAVIISINSPGGTTAGGEELYEALNALRLKKPVVATIDELGASAAYMTAIASDRIFARRLSLVGSIGVLMQHVNAGRLLETIGLEFDKVQTGPLKAEPDIDDPLTGATRASLQALVDDSYAWFVDIVAERRNRPRPEIVTLADGRIMTGRMALDAGLIDAIGGEVEAMAWLESTHDLPADMPIYTVYPLPESEFNWLTRFVSGQINDAFGLAGSTGIPLDGLVSLWQAGGR